MHRAGLSYRQIAQALGSSTTTVHRQVVRLERTSAP
jgi:DNA-directed RNA polymerase specialized sigma24 family protein